MQIEPHSKVALCPDVRPLTSKRRPDSENSGNFVSISEVWSYSVIERDGLEVTDATEVR